MKSAEKKHGIIAGISLIVMAIAAGFSFGFAHSRLVVAGAPETTLQNLITNKSLFFMELSGWSLIFITDIIVAVALYFFFLHASRQLSLITAFIRIVYSLILGMAIVQLFKIVPALSLSEPLSDKLNASTIASYLQLFETFWSVGLIVFGLHLIGLGYLSVKSPLVPKPLAYLLYFGGISYTFLHSARQLSLFDTQTLASIETILAMPMALAEILLAFWLIYKGFQRSSKITS